MPTNVTLSAVTLSAATLFAFLLVLARVAGALVFVPLPGITAVTQPARAALALGFTLALAPRWPASLPAEPTPATLLVWIAAEAALGVAVGLSVAVVVESLTLAAQILGLQAGYAYASTVDPNTEADSGVLLVFAQLAGGMLFFALGLDREVLGIFAWSLERVPAGTYEFRVDSVWPLIRLGSELLAAGVRLALPVVALLVMVDVALALLGRLNAQLQLLSLAFPAKMLIALAVLSWVAVLFPGILSQLAGHAFRGARETLGTSRWQDTRIP